MQEPRYTTHPRVVAGVMLIASLMLFSTVFAIAIFLFGVVNPPEYGLEDGYRVVDVVLSDYFTRTRVLIAGVVALVATVGFWIASGD